MGKIHKDIAMMMLEAAKDSEQTEQMLIKVGKKIKPLLCYCYAASEASWEQYSVWYHSP